MEKKKKPKKEMVDTQVSILEKGKEERVKKTPEDPDEEFELELDFDDIVVQAIDGVLIQGDQEEVRLLFYYYKPDRVDVEEETIRCKGVAEFRTSSSTFKAIAKSFNAKVRDLRTHQRKIDEHIFQEKLSMSQHTNLSYFA